MTSNIIHGDKLPDDLTLVINGARNSGKTTLLTKLIFNLDELTVANKRGRFYTLKTDLHQITRDYKIDYNNILIYAKNQNQFLYQFIKHGIENKIKFSNIGILIETFFRQNLDVDEIEELCKRYAEEYPLNVDQNMNITITISDDINVFDLNKLDKKRKNLIIFDDCSEDKNQDVQINFFQNGRHHNCSCIYLTHRFHTHGFTRIRTNTSAFILFEQNQKVLEQLMRDININKEKNEFYSYARSAWTRNNNDVKKYIYFNADSKELLISPF